MQGADVTCHDATSLECDRALLPKNLCLAKPLHVMSVYRRATEGPTTQTLPQGPRHVSPVSQDTTIVSIARMWAPPHENDTQSLSSLSLISGVCWVEGCFGRCSSTSPRRPCVALQAFRVFESEDASKAVPCPGSLSTPGWSLSSATRCTGSIRDSYV